MFCGPPSASTPERHRATAAGQLGNVGVLSHISLIKALPHSRVSEMGRCLTPDVIRQTAKFGETTVTLSASVA